MRQTVLPLMIALLCVPALGACGSDDTPADPAAAWREQADAICGKAKDASQQLLVDAGSLDAFGKGRDTIVKTEVGELVKLTPPAALKADADRLVDRLAFSAGIDRAGATRPPVSKLNPGKEQLDAADEAYALATKLRLPRCER